MLPMEKSVTFSGACANEIISSINRSFVYKSKEERSVRIGYFSCFFFRGMFGHRFTQIVEDERTFSALHLFFLIKCYFGWVYVVLKKCVYLTEKFLSTCVSDHMLGHKI